MKTRKERKRSAGKTGGKRKEKWKDQRKENKVKVMKKRGNQVIIIETEDQLVYFKRGNFLLIDASVCKITLCAICGEYRMKRKKKNSRKHVKRYITAKPLITRFILLWRQNFKKNEEVKKQL